MAVNNNHLREYEYVDNIEINSILAQFNQGLNLKHTRTNGKTEEAGKGHTLSGNSKISGQTGMPLMAEINGEAQLGSKISTSQNVNVMDQESVETILNDYSVEVLENYLNDQNLLLQENQANVGNFVQIEGGFDITNFKSLKNSSDVNTIKKLWKLSSDQEKQEIRDSENLTRQQKRDQIAIISKNNKNAEHEVSSIFEMINLLGHYGSALFPNAILISNNEFVSYCELDNFRMSEAQLNMLTNSSRKIRVLGIVENIIENSEKYKNGDIPELNPYEIGRVNSMMQNIILSSFDLINTGALVIKPLAIYFVD